ncbi:sensor histidine kinase N-terminal domain-containing protein [Chenggangzhangella methanolivorans]|uniref:histidine kinase n=1 Tax=Chenggangzhangella methanolivorans TaxID=1437009 RepID=A0A9E6RIE3_9HYPH|nr:sensor histidine kinase N-terminal domain-containing protein [Chenggangzhangella methanolivorans]QZO02031.1 sensor histidine kinase N-terminal domain-containing protein [Chenggangzhangella methanolivorans]
MRSLRVRLFATLIVATGALWLIAAVWIYVGARQEVEHVLDTRLQEAARMVSSLVAAGSLPPKPEAGGPPGLIPEAAGYERQLSCQIWSLDDRLVARSSGAPDEKLSDGGAGFSERVVNGEPWRVYAVQDEAKGIRVLVGDRLGLRERLVTDLIKGLLWPAAFILPLLGVLIWASLGRGLRPLDRITRELSGRDAEDMSSVDAGAAPSEIRPLAAALNGLFGKVERARRHEREVTAFAAHELRTPLAGLKTQAQIAVAAQDPAVRDNALRQVVRAVDRTSRLVTQLLALARLDAGPSNGAVEAVPLGSLIDEVAELCRAAAPDVPVMVDPEIRSMVLAAPRESLMLLLKNLTENALQHSPVGGVVTWRRTAGEDAIDIVDEGLGASEAELPQLTQRFFRGAGSSGAGTGLGLAIAAAAAANCRARIELMNRADRPGLSAQVHFEAGVMSASRQAGMAA